MKLREGNLEFDFGSAIAAFKFDEPGKAIANCHGLSHCMKAVDFVAEYDDYYVFIEVKSPPDATHYAGESKERALVDGLVRKFRDSFLYRWAEDKLDKPVRYYCLVDIDNALTGRLMREMRRALPYEKLPRRWERKPAEVMAVTNVSGWNRNFPEIPVTQL